MLTILSKELKSYFYSITAYVFMGILLFLGGLFFVLNNVLAQSPAYSIVLSGLTFIIIFTIPIITMKSLSEESRNKTDQLLLTSPQSIMNIIIGKYLAAVILFAVTLLTTVLFPFMIAPFGTLAIGEITAIYIGVFMVGCCFIAIGIFISSLTENLVVSAVGSIGVNLCIWIIDWIKTGLPADAASGLGFLIIIILILAAVLYYFTNSFMLSLIISIVGIVISVIVYFSKSTLFEGLISEIVGWFSILERHQPFTMGIISINSILYFISFSFICVFMTVRVIEKKRWN